jgi:hypothetical protein
MSTAPGGPASFAKGGGTAVPTQPTNATPTISVTSNALIYGTFAGQTVNISVIATSEASNRKAPTLTLDAAPAGLTLSSVVSVDSPHGGGPGYVDAQYAWTPTRDQIGLAAVVTFRATTSGGSTTQTVTFPAVQDAPSAVTGLTAVNAGDHIAASWNASPFGVAPISYVVSACYRNADIREVASTCDVITTTTDTTANIPLFNPTPTVVPEGGVATYFAVLVKAVDVVGTASPTVSANVQ